ncbi:MerR family DNA-binding transcriptional regulator [Burkholderia cepacia]|uniref:MerR family DNA-binding transcriptional regulator n=1 Tax=Burkholderia cepacia TaxID=292 RepID=UPI0007C85127|nr:MerR family DNA-binding transcriptional regulator [Burkholderia cepacia]
MKIGELAERTGLTPSRIRFYERIGLFSLLEALHRKVRDIEALEARLARSKAQVMSLIAEIAAKPASVDCATHAKRLLSRVPPGNAAEGGEAAAGLSDGSTHTHGLDTLPRRTITFKQS